MTKKVLPAILLSFVLLSVNLAFLNARFDLHAQADGDWTLLGGPTVPGGTVNALAIAPSAPDTLYALVQSHAGPRLFRSDEAALSWQATYTFTEPVNALAVDPTDAGTVYTGARDGLFRSTDGGLNWTQVYTVGAAFAVISPTLLYAGGQIAEGDDNCRAGYFGIARSDDGGATWSMTPIGCAAELTVIAANPENPHILYAAGTNWTARLGLFVRSTDGGSTWSSVDLERFNVHAIRELVVDPTRPERLFASDTSGVLRSTDGGDTWERLNQPYQQLPHTHSSLAIDANGTVYAIPAHALEGTSVYRSDDGGDTWWVSAARLPKGANAVAASPRQAGTLYAGLDEYGILKSTSGGSAWHENNAGVRSLAVVEVLAVAGRRAPQLVYAAALQPRGGLFRSDDGGLTWVTVITDTPIQTAAVNPMTPTVAYAGGVTRLYSTWDGQRWGWSFSDLEINDIVVAPENPEWVYVAAERERQGYIGRRSPDDNLWPGPSWRWLPVSDTLWVSAVAVDPRNPQVVFAAGRPLSSYGRVYRSYDAGESWHEVLSDIPGDVTSLVIHPDRPDTIYAVTQATGLIYRSQDGGDTWYEWSGHPLGGIYGFILDALGVPYEATSDGVFRLDTGMPVWMPFGLHERWVGALAVVPDRPQVLFASTRNGIWRRETPLWRARLPLVRREPHLNLATPTITPTPTPTVSGPLPDLVISRIYYRGNCMTESGLRAADICVRNQGTARLTDPFVVRSLDGRLELMFTAHLQQMEGICKVAEVAGGSEIVADADNQVIESDETNNRNFAPIFYILPTCAPTPTATPTSTILSTPAP